MLLLGLGGYAAYRFITEDTPTAFTDIVLFVMALVGLLIALASLGIWMGLRRFLHEDISAQISRVEEATRNEAISRMAAKVGTAFWHFYENTQNVVFRDEALKIVSGARDILEGREGVEREDLKCRIYNNLAFAYAERGKTQDTAIAHFLADHVREKIRDYPNFEVTWLETYAYVLYRLPKKRDDKEKALIIINELLQRPDISEEEKNVYRKRYSIT